jgi:exodeoxyribonuclease VII small subunit
VQEEQTEQVSGEEPRYAEAIQELETILDKIENDEVDLDDLGAKVERAAVLIQLCRQKIERTEFQVKKIVESLEGQGA